MNQLRVTQIFVESIHAKAGVRKRIGPLRYLFPEKYIDRLIHDRHFPNNILLQLHKKKKIHLRSHQLPFKQKYSNREAENIPIGDVWVFSLLNHADEFAFDDSFFECVKSRAKQHNILIINLCSHIDDGRLMAQATLPEFPKVAKLKANGSVGDYNLGSYSILQDANSEAYWRKEHVHDEGRYVLQPWLADKRNDDENGLYFMERWINLGGDLTVGLRRSTAPIIKQFNSVTTYLRDSRLLMSENEFESVCEFQKKGEMRKGSMPLSFLYHADDEFWDRRYAMLSSLHSHTGFEVGSLDAIVLENDEIVVLDYNEHTLESAYEDLMYLWSQRIFKMISKSL